MATTLNDGRRRQVLASLVPVKARGAGHDISLTDYSEPSVFTPRQNQTPNDTKQPARSEVVHEEDQSALSSIDTKQVAYSDIHHVQQEWVEHQQERFDMLLRSPRRVIPPRSSTELPRGNYSTPLRQLHHIERLFQTAGESLPTSIETADYLVASQCYAMVYDGQLIVLFISLLANTTCTDNQLQNDVAQALEQLAALTKSLQDQKE